MNEWQVWEGRGRLGRYESEQDAIKDMRKRATMWRLTVVITVVDGEITNVESGGAFYERVLV